MELFASLILDPRETLLRIADSDYGYSGFWILLGALVSASAGFLIFRLPAGPGAAYTIIFGIFTQFIFFTFLIFLFSALYSFFAESYGVCGRGRRLFKTLPFSSLPFIFIAPATLIVKAMFPAAGGLLIAPFYLFLIAWSIYMQIGLIGSMFEIPARSAAAVFALPWVITLGAIIIVPLLGLLGIAAILLL